MDTRRAPLGEICAQIKDPARNGGKDMAALVRHMAEDSLVSWGWSPGPGRHPAPGTQAEFGALIRAWAETGAHCPAVFGTKVPEHRSNLALRLKLAAFSNPRRRSIGRPDLKRLLA